MDKIAEILQKKLGGKDSEKKIGGMHVRKVSGGYHLKHHSEDGAPMKGAEHEHVMPDLKSAHAHMVSAWEAERSDKEALPEGVERQAAGAESKE